MEHAEFRNPRLVEVYDAECPWAQDDDFFLAILRETAAVRVLDLGCGTGRLALGMAARGYRVTGVDPAAASLAAARAKPGAESVTWVEGTSSVLPDSAFDAAVMTSHVAQLFVTDDEWAAVLADLARALVPGGMLSFDSRDPDSKAWERWNPTDSRREITLPDGGVVRIWTEVTAVVGGAVSFTHHYTLPDGTELDSEATLRFRTEEEIRVALAEAGFDVDRVYGGWSRDPVGRGQGELLVVARRNVIG